MMNLIKNSQHATLENEIVWFENKQTNKHHKQQKSLKIKR